MGNVLARYAALIIEPDDDILDIITIVLLDEGIKVLKFKSFSQEVVKAVRTHTIGIAILAFRASGEDAIHALTTLKTVVSVPFIAMSCDMDISEKSMKNGFDMHITKPFDIDELSWLVRSLMKVV